MSQPARAQSSSHPESWQTPSISWWRTETQCWQTLALGQARRCQVLWGRGWQMTRGDMPRLLLWLLQEDDGWWQPSLMIITSSTRPTTFPKPTEGTTGLPVTLARNQGVILNYPLCLIPTISWETKSCEFHLVPSSALCHHPISGPPWPLLCLQHTWLIVLSFP